MQPQQPNFQVLNQNMNVLTQPVGNIRRQLANLQNVPILNAGALLNDSKQFKLISKPSKVNQRALWALQYSKCHSKKCPSKSTRNPSKSTYHAKNTSYFLYFREMQSRERTKNSSIQSVKERKIRFKTVIINIPANFLTTSLALLRLSGTKYTSLNCLFLYKINPFFATQYKGVNFNTLLTFYNLPTTGSVLIQRERLSNFLGLKII